MTAPDLASAVRENIDLAPLNTLRLAARARYYSEATSREALKAQILWARENDLECRVLGGGSNIVFRGDFPGLVIHMALRGRFWAPCAGDSAVLKLEAGENWHESVLYSARAGFSGIENLALIPGTAGAAPVQNIGAYGVELADVLLDVEVLDTQTLQLLRLDRKRCEFSYRESRFKKEPGRYLITQLRLKLTRNRPPVLDYQGLAEAFPHSHSNPPTPLQVAEAVMALRAAKLPDPAILPNAGSFFKNPVVAQDHFQRLQRLYPGLIAYPDANGMKLAAGWLIDQCGWKGFREGQVGVHNRQALVLINHGTAIGEDVLGLAARIQADILERFGIMLEIEPRIFS